MNSVSICSENHSLFFSNSIRYIFVLPLTSSSIEINEKKNRKMSRINEYVLLNLEQMNL